MRHAKMSAWQHMQDLSSPVSARSIPTNGSNAGVCTARRPGQSLRWTTLRARSSNSSALVTGRSAASAFFVMRFPNPYRHFSDCP